MKPTRRLAAILGMVVLFVPGILRAQSNEEIDRLLSQDSAQTGSAAYLVLTAAGIIEEDATPAQAVSVAQERGVLSAEARPDQPIRFGEYAYLLTDSFGIPGGLMYRLIPGPRYAAREVVYQGWTRSRRAVGEELSGDAVARIMSVYLNQHGGGR
ncbi:MAG: hypothetical protein ACOCYB_07355 [Alkalispirochaeta sp.]